MTIIAILPPTDQYPIQGDEIAPTRAHNIETGPGTDHDIETDVPVATTMTGSQKEGANAGAEGEITLLL